MLHAAFLCLLPNFQGLAVESLYAEEMLVALPLEHRLAGQSAIAIVDLEDVPLFLISHGFTDHSLESSLTAACEREGFAPRIAQTVPEFMLALNLVVAVLGCTFVPPYMQNIHSEKIMYRRISPRVEITMQTVLAQRQGETSETAKNLCVTASNLFTRDAAIPNVTQHIDTL